MRYYKYSNIYKFINNNDDPVVRGGRMVRSGKMANMEEYEVEKKKVGRSETEKRCGEAEGSERCRGEKAFAFKTKMGPAVCWSVVPWKFVFRTLADSSRCSVIYKIFLLQAMLVFL